MNLTPSEIQFWTLIVLTLTLLVLGKYAWDTAQIAKAAVEQRELMHRPLVVIPELRPRDSIVVAFEQATTTTAEKKPDLLGFEPSQPSIAELPRDLHLENVGMGPAFDIKIRDKDQNGVANYRVFLPHLKVGEPFALVLAINRHRDKWKLEIEYEGLCGTRFVTVYELEEGVPRGLSVSRIRAKR